MLQPTWLVDVLAGVMLATSTYCVTRLVAARLWGRTLHRDINVAHVAMGVAMAGMLVTALKTLPDGAWEVVFAALVVRFGTRAVRLAARRTSGLDRHHLSHNLTHMVMAGAMFYMFRETSSGVSSATSAPSMSAMGSAGGTSNLAFLTLVLVVILFASAVWHADELTRYTTARRQLVRVGVAVPGGARAPSSGGTVLGFTALSPSTERTVDEAQAEQGHWLAPRLEMGCHIAMCITMGYMLVLML